MLVAWRGRRVLGICRSAQQHKNVKVALVDAQLTIVCIEAISLRDRVKSGLEICWRRSFAR